MASGIAPGAPAPVKTIPLGPQPSFVLPITGAFAPASNRLYVFNGSWDGFTVPAPMIAIIDTSTNTFIGRLQPPVPAGMNLVEAASQHDCVFTNPATNKVYAAYSGGGSGMIVAIDAATDTIAQTVTVAGGITNMAFNPATNKIYVAQLSAANPTQVFVYDVNTLAQVAAIGGVDNGGLNGIFGPPLAANPANNKIYTAASGSGVLVIDGSRDVAEALVALPAEIGALQVNPVNNRVYAGFPSTFQSFYVIDGATDSLSATVNTTSMFGAFTMDPLRNILYSPMGGGFQIDGATNTLMPGPVYGGFSPPVNVDCSIIFLGAPDFSLHNWYAGCDGTYLVADTATGSYKNAIPVSYVTMWARGLIHPVNHSSYLISTFGNSVTALDPVSLSPALIQLGNVPIGIAANPVTNRVYVADGPSNAAVAIDGATNTVLSKIFAQTRHPGRSASFPVGIAVNSATNRYVFSQQGTAVELDGAGAAAPVYIDPGFKGNGTPSPAGFNFAAINSATNKMYTADSRTVYVTDLQTGAFAAFLGPACTAGGLAINPANNSLLVSESCQAGGRLEVFDGSTGVLLQTADLSAFIPAGAATGSVILNPKTSKLYVANNGLNSAGQTTEVLNAVTLAHLATVPGVAGTLAVNTVLNAVYGAFSGPGGGLAVIDGNTDTLSSTFGSGLAVSGLAVNETTNMIYAGDSRQGTVNVFQGDAPSPGAFTISGRVLSGSGAGVAGVTIAAQGLTTSTTVTDTNGAFLLMGIQAGTYTVAPTSTGYFYGPASQTVTITTASITGVNFDALTTPIAVTGLTLSPWTTIGPGVTTTATVTINQPAPPGGIVLNLSASNTKPAKFPATVTVPAGSSTANFTVQGNSVGAVTSTTITTTYQGSFAPQPSSASVNLTVSPTDALHILSATWSKSTQILNVSATSTNPQSILQLFLASNNQLLGTFTTQGSGNYSIQVSFTSGTPASVNVKSNLGGSTGQGVTVVP